MTGDEVDCLTELYSLQEAYDALAAEVRSLRMREGYIVQGKSLKEWADMAEAETAAWLEGGDQ